MTFQYAVQLHGPTDTRYRNCQFSLVLRLNGVNGNKVDLFTTSMRSGIPMSQWISAAISR